MNRKDFLCIVSKTGIGVLLVGCNNSQSPSNTEALADSSSSNNELIVCANDVNFADSLDNYVIVQNCDQNNTLIYAYDLRLEPSIIANKNYGIFSYTTIIYKELKNSGNNFLLLSYNVDSIDNATINTTGDDGEVIPSFIEPLRNGCRKNSDPLKAKDADNIINNDVKIKDEGTNKEVIIHHAGEQVDKVPGGSINGKDGGNICFNAFKISSGKIRIIANGGKGSTGEGGQDGLSGCDGESGDSGSWCVDGTKGKDGALAQNGGNGALGGWGGKGGYCLINIRDKESDNLIIESNGGNQGESGEGGLKGVHGGVGGAGGRTYERFENGPDKPGRRGFRPAMPSTASDDQEAKITKELELASCRQKGTLKRGDDHDKEPGKPGEKPENNNSRKGKNGIVEVNNETTDLNFLADYCKYIPVEFAQLLLLKAESLYLNKNFDKTIDLLKYILTISQNNPGASLTPQNKTDIQKFLPNYLHEYDTFKKLNQWDVVKSKATTYLNQINNQADFFGNTADYVTILDPIWVGDMLTKNAHLIDKFEDYVNNFFKKQQKNTENAASIDKLIDQYDKNINDFKNLLDQNKAIILTLHEEILNRYARAEDLKRELMAQQEKFKRAVESANHGCSLSSVLKFITTVSTFVSGVTAVVGVFANVPPLIASTKDLATNLGKNIHDVDPGIDILKWNEVFSGGKEDHTIIKQIKHVEGITDDIGKNAKRFNEAFRELQKEEGDKDNYNNLLSLEKDKFDKTIEKYLNDFPEARELKEEFHSYIDYVEATTKKREQLTNLTLDAYTLINNIKASQNSISTLKSENTNISLGIATTNFKQAIFDLYYTTRWNIIKLIYLQEKALQFLDPDKFPPQNLFDGKFEDLLAQGFNRNASIFSYYAINANSLFGKAHNNIPVIISKKDYPVSMESFKRGNSRKHIMNFSIPVTNKTLNFYGVNLKAYSVWVYLRGVEFRGSLKNIRFHFIHSGRSLVNSGGKVYSFLHGKKDVPFSYDSSMNHTQTLNTFPADFEGNLAGFCGTSDNKCSLGVSPFTSWELILEEEDNPGIDLSGVTAIELYFEFYYQG